MPSKPKGRGVSVIALDLGSTTGICGVTIDKAWLRGMGEPTWDGLRNAVKARFAYQVGREPRAFDLDKDRTTRLDRFELNERMLPILARQPLVEQDGMRSTERFEAILDGKWPKGGGDLLMVDAEEVVQVRQIAGLLENYPDAALVIEDFILRTQVRGREVLSSDRLRSSVTSQEILHGEGRTPFLQQPALAKSTATDERLKRAGLYFAGMPHATDAARHVATFLRRARQQESVRAAAWPAHFSDEFDD